MSTNYHDWLPRVISIAKEAAVAILDIYQNKNYQIKKKLDNSPITAADLLAHQIIKNGLFSIDPALPLLSEEGEAPPFEIRSTWSRYWLVDPLDGTKEFIHGTGEFTVNIALIENGKPVLGVVLAPALQHTYWATKGQGAFFEAEGNPSYRIHTNQLPQSPLKIVVSRRSHQKSDSLNSHWSALLNRLGEYELFFCGSALKICLVAKGEADLYPRLGTTCEWDTAAGQCILEEAGGQLVDFECKPLLYNNRITLENPGFYATSDSYLASVCCG